MKSLRLAVNRHNDMMNDARSGKGIDRHLFGMWCAAFDADLPIPELYDDPMYKKRSLLQMHTYCEWSELVNRSYF